MRHRIYTVLSIYNSVGRLNICFDRCKPNGCKPNGSNLTILRQRASIAMMLPRCQESARGVRREGEQTIQCFECFFYRGSYMSAHVLLNLLNELLKIDKMRGLSFILSLFRS